MSSRPKRKPNYDQADVLAQLGDMAEWMANRYDVIVGTKGTTDTPIECPQHRPGHTTSANVHLTDEGTQIFKCFRCDLAGGPFAIVEKFGEASSFTDAVNMLGEALNAPEATRHTRREPKTPPNPKLPERRPVADNNRRPVRAAAQREKERYLEERRWPTETWDRHGLEAVYRWVRELKRETLAIRHPYIIDGTTFGYQDRIIEDCKNKWLSAPRVKLLPYNLDALEDESRGYLHICEGPADAITLELATFPGYPVIAAPGAKTWRRNWGKYAAGRTVIVTVDNDEAGAEYFKDVVESITGRARWIASIQPPDQYKDLGEWWIAEGPAMGDAIEAQLLAIEAHRQAAPAGTDR